MWVNASGRSGSDDWSSHSLFEPSIDVGRGKLTFLGQTALTSVLTAWSSIVGGSLGGAV